MGGMQVRHRFSGAVHVFYPMRHHGTPYVPFANCGCHRNTAHSATIE